MDKFRISKKLGVAVATIILIGLNEFLGLHFDREQIVSIAGMAGAYVLGQGAVDAVKEAKK